MCCERCSALFAPRRCCTSCSLVLFAVLWGATISLALSQARALFGLYLVVKKTTKPGSASAPMAELCEKTLKTLHKGTPTAAIVDGLFKTMSA